MDRNQLFWGRLFWISIKIQKEIIVNRKSKDDLEKLKNKKASKNIFKCNKDYENVFNN